MTYRVIYATSERYHNELGKEALAHLAEQGMACKRFSRVVTDFSGLEHEIKIAPHLRSHVVIADKFIRGANKGRIETVHLLKRVARLGGLAIMLDGYNQGVVNGVYIDGKSSEVLSGEGFERLISEARTAMKNHETARFK